MTESSRLSDTAGWFNRTLDIAALNLYFSFSLSLRLSQNLILNNELFKSINLSSKDTDFLKIQPNIIMARNEHGAHLMPQPNNSSDQFKNTTKS